MKKRLRTLRQIGIADSSSQKETPRVEFRALRSARRATRPSLRHLLKKVDENFYSLR